MQRTMWHNVLKVSEIPHNDTASVVDPANLTARRLIGPTFDYTNLALCRQYDVAFDLADH